MRQDQKQGEKNKIGAYGEEIVVRDLRRKGFQILEQNYLKKWGELDVIVEKDSQIHFVEVKTVSYETKERLQQNVSRETFRPEENVHPQKLRRMYRAIETWLAENHCDLDWQIDIAAVRLVPREKYATVKYLWNVIE